MNNFEEIEKSFIRYYNEIIMERITRLHNKNAQDVMQISRKYLSENDINKYGDYELYCYFVTLLNQRDNKNYAIISKELFDKQKGENIYKHKQLKFENKKNELNYYQRTINDVVVRVINKDFIVKESDSLKLYHDIDTYVGQELMSRNLENPMQCKLEIFRKLKELLNVDLPTYEFDLVVFDIASKVGHNCNFDFKDPYIVRFIIETIVKEVLSSDNYKNDFGGMTGIAEKNVTELISKHYNIKFDTKADVENNIVEEEQDNVDINDILKVFLNITLISVTVTAILLNVPIYLEYNYIGVILTICIAIYVFLILYVLTFYLMFYYFSKKKYVKTIEFILLTISCFPTGWLSYILFSRIYTIWNLDIFMLITLILNVIYGYLLFGYLLFKIGYETIKYFLKSDN
ncbi:hypothetical protein Catovirus_1_380 [Catovirus CTV1]|uniref:Uncharacterized protein n=1 Tax=Catovirus CTV1 TaxID=1977631 RepID=A0A1V0S9D3_9VIRU|nr:hypothetical protein Catovirus_1_380 [Catovirus CTV1]